ESCANDLQCANDKACIGGKCSDPCSLRGACGDNALCQTVLHRPRCSCPSCYIGRPNVECKPDPKCEEVTTPRPNDPKIVSVACETNDDCHESLRCDASGQCSDPCTVPSPFVCDANKKCVSRRHRPSCVCTHGFIVNDSGELVCAPEKRECFGDDGCASNMACLEGRCLNPCFGNGKRSAPCPDDKACVVVDHRPTCVCMKDCSPSLSICLRDSGCPDELACRNYQCVNPCETTTCAEDTPCYVEDHKPICKFCPPGFVKDVRHGCLKGNMNTTQTTLFSVSVRLVAISALIHSRPLLFRIISATYVFLFFVSVSPRLRLGKEWNGTRYTYYTIDLLIVFQKTILHF
uniref:EGF-like domain-containing protein n=1 Tax=Anopheles maculatus TaxID=74869 RepID=A0A182SXM8_9DIPT